MGHLISATFLLLNPAEFKGQRLDQEPLIGR